MRAVYAEITPRINSGSLIYYLCQLLVTITGRELDPIFDKNE